ncbi:MAG: hypothetical protein ACJAZC_001445 [Cryomorphaceae bacterium]
MDDLCKYIANAKLSPNGESIGSQMLQNIPLTSLGLSILNEQMGGERLKPSQVYYFSFVLVGRNDWERIGDRGVLILKELGFWGGCKDYKIK